MYCLYEAHSVNTTQKNQMLDLISNMCKKNYDKPKCLHKHSANLYSNGYEYIWRVRVI